MLANRKQRPRERGQSYGDKIILQGNFLPNGLLLPTRPCLLTSTPPSNSPLCCESVTSAKAFRIQSFYLWPLQLWRPSLQHTSFVGMVQGKVKWGIWDLNSNAHIPVFQGSRVIWGICYAESIWNKTAEGEESLQWCFFLLCCVLKTTTTTTAKTSLYHNNSNKAAMAQPLVSKLCLLCRECSLSGQGSGEMLKGGICGWTEDWSQSQDDAQHDGIHNSHMAFTFNNITYSDRIFPLLPASVTTLQVPGQYSKRILG